MKITCVTKTQHITRGQHGKKTISWMDRVKVQAHHKCGCVCLRLSAQSQIRIVLIHGTGHWIMDIQLSVCVVIAWVLLHKILVFFTKAYMQYGLGVHSRANNRYHLFWLTAGSHTETYTPALLSSWFSYNLLFSGMCGKLNNLTGFSPAMILFVLY